MLAFWTSRELDAGAAERRDALARVVQRLADLQRRALQVQCRAPSRRSGSPSSPARTAAPRMFVKVSSTACIESTASSPKVVMPCSSLAIFCRPSEVCPETPPVEASAASTFWMASTCSFQAATDALRREDERRGDAERDAGAEVPDLRADLVERLAELADALARPVHVAGELGARALQLLGGGLDVAERLLAPLAEGGQLLADLLGAVERDALRDGLALPSVVRPSGAWRRARPAAPPRAARSRGCGTACGAGRWRCRRTSAPSG